MILADINRDNFYEAVEEALDLCFTSFYKFKRFKYRSHLWSN